MSATSGIPIHSDLQHAFAVAQHDDLRFLKLTIRNEYIILETTAPMQGDFSVDLDALQDLLEDDVPAYILAKFDETPSQWLAITYVPDTAKVRDKMLYASTRNALTKSLGSASFTDSLFATHKSDLTATAYAAHCRNQTAPKPLSAREQDMADVQAAERAAARSGNQGRTARKTHIGGAALQVKWSEDAKEAVKTLVLENGSSKLIVMSIDPATESLILSSDEECAPNNIGASLPLSDPSYSFFVWSHAQRRDIMFIYSCPSTSAIKHRMIFSSGVSSILAAAKEMGVTIARKIETSDPQEVDEAFLRSELGLSGSGTEEKRPFAKPKGPARKQR